MYGVEYLGNGDARILRIGFATLNDAIDWKNANDPHNARKSIARTVHFISFSGIIVWHGKD